MDPHPESEKETRIPAFANLGGRGRPPGSAWGVFGSRDNLGTLNFADAACVREAARLVERGKVFALTWDLALPNPAFGHRATFTHTRLELGGGICFDDYLDRFYLQGSSQWDGLRHFADPEFGFYDGVTAAELRAGNTDRLGIEHFARNGLAARGVLVDVGRALSKRGEAMDAFEFYPIGADLIESTLDTQGLVPWPGDVLLVRTGWIEAYEALSESERIALARDGHPGAPGLFGPSIAEYLWEHQIAAVAVDNPAMEASHRGRGIDDALHVALIARLGMPIGELWRLGPLAEDCAEDGRYTCLLCSAPLAVEGAAGSPANALAIK